MLRDHAEALPLTRIALTGADFDLASQAGRGDWALLDGFSLALPHTRNSAAQHLAGGDAGHRRSYAIRPTPITEGSD